MIETVSLRAREADKYRRMWQVSDYAAHSPGVQWLPVFLELVKGERLGREPGTVLDIGCGDGQAMRALRERGFAVTGYDLDAFTDDVVTGALWDLPPVPRYDYGYCCDVLEHVPEQFSMLSVVRMLGACGRVFATVCTEPDQFGVRIGEPLHLTVKPFTWWRDSLAEVSTLLDARDGLNTAVFYLEARGD